MESQQHFLLNSARIIGIGMCMKSCVISTFAFRQHSRWPNEIARYFAPKWRTCQKVTFNMVRMVVTAQRCITFSSVRIFTMNQEARLSLLQEVTDKTCMVLVVLTKDAISFGSGHVFWSNCKTRNKTGYRLPKFGLVKKCVECR